VDIIGKVIILVAWLVKVMEQFQKVLLSGSVSGDFGVGGLVGNNHVGTIIAKFIDSQCYRKYMALVDWLDGITMQHISNSYSSRFSLRK
jgi:hypothetical protein